MEYEMKHTMNGFVHAKPNDCGSGPSDWSIEGFNLTVLKYDDLKGMGYILVAPTVITFEIPENWDPRIATVEVLRKRQEALRAEFTKRITDIENEISKYLAIGN